MKKNDFENNESYQYPKDEYVAEPQKPETVLDEEVVELTKSESPIKNFIFKNKRMVAVSAIAVILLIIFQVMNHGDNEKISVSPAAIKPSVEKNPPTAVDSSTYSSAPVQENNSNTGFLQQSVSSVSDAVQQNKKDIEQLKSDIQLLHDQMSQVTATGDELKQVMTLLLEEVKNLQKQVLEKTHESSGAPGAKKAVGVSYKIRALVEGRAWLVSSDGLTESVTVGDTIPGLGRVESIDDSRGAVVTSSGETIRLGN